MKRLAPGWNYSGHGCKSDRNIETVIGRKVAVSSSGCWLWRGALTSDGYANHATVGPVHRFVYDTLAGEIPEGYHLHHECEVKNCVNPEHLVPLSPGDHMRRHAEMRRAS